MPNLADAVFEMASIPSNTVPELKTGDEAEEAIVKAIRGQNVASARKEKSDGIPR